MQDEEYMELNLSVVDVSPFQPRKYVSIARIQRTVADYYHVTIHNLLGSSRLRSIVQPRHIAMFLSKKHTGKTLVKIGKAFGRRDHTTVRHAIKRVQNDYMKHPRLQSDIKFLQLKILKGGAH